MGRFVSVDPFAGKYPDWSPYVYTFDNPYRYVDPDGRFAQVAAPVAGGAAALYIGGSVLIAVAGAAYIEVTHPGTIESFGDVASDAFDSAVDDVVSAAKAVSKWFKGQPQSTGMPDAMKTPQPTGKTKPDRNKKPDKKKDDDPDPLEHQKEPFPDGEIKPPEGGPSTEGDQPPVKPDPNLEPTP